MDAPSSKGMTPLPRVRLVIPCRNEAGFIGRCLASIAAADRTGMELEVRVVDGQSTDGTQAEIARWSEEHPWIILVENTERATPHALNLGLRPEGYDVGIILGAHAEIDRNFLKGNLELLAANPGAGCVGGVIENVYLDAPSRRIGRALAHPFGVGTAHFRTGRKEGEVDTVAFGAYRRVVFEQVGFFDERLVRNQDDEFNYRVIKGGWKIILGKQVQSRYYVRASLGKLYKQYGQYGYWKVYVNLLHGQVTTFRQLVPAAFVLFVLAGGVLSLISRAWLGPYVAGLVLYVVAAIWSAWRASGSIRDVPGVAVAFLVVHTAYGFGYLRGIWHLALRGKRPEAKAGRLTR